MGDEVFVVPPLTAVLVAHAADFRLRTGLSHEGWAERVDREYCARVAEAQRNVPAPDLQQVTGAEDYRKLLRAWDQRLRMFSAGTERFPLDLAEAFIEAMDDPWRLRCKRERAWRVGLWGAVRHAADVAGDHTAWRDVLTDFGSLTQEMVSVLDNSPREAGESADLADLMRQIHALQADLHSLEQQVRRRQSEV